MSRKNPKTRKGAAAIYVVIFTATLLGVITLSFVRMMVGEARRTTNYNLSQSAYNSAMAGIEDAKIVMLRYQNCRTKGSYKYGASEGSTDGKCAKYTAPFSNSATAKETSQNCNIVGSLLHNTSANAGETKIQTSSSGNSDVIDQAYTCVKISSFTPNFLTVLKENNSTKLIPLRTEDQEKHNSINRIQVQWFSQENYNKVVDNRNTLLSQYDSRNSVSSTEKLVKNNNSYSALSNIGTALNKFSTKPIVPSPLQVSFVQTATTYTTADFYTSNMAAGKQQTNRGTLLLRPSSSTSVADSLGINRSRNGNHSNILPTDALPYSANKSMNTPIDVYCSGVSMSDWGDYACSADIYIPDPVNGTDSFGGTSRNELTTYLLLNLPYGNPETEVSVKMYHCNDASEATTATNCGDPIEFAGVQPMIDSTGRANSLFRRVESRIELYDTDFPISSYGLAMIDSSNSKGIAKDYYVTKSTCSYSWTEPNEQSYRAPIDKSETCAPSAGQNGE